MPADPSPSTSFISAGRRRSTSATISCSTPPCTAARATMSSSIRRKPSCSATRRDTSRPPAPACVDMHTTLWLTAAQTTGPRQLAGSSGGRLAPERGADLLADGVRRRAGHRAIRRKLVILDAVNGQDLAHARGDERLLGGAEVLERRRLLPCPDPGEDQPPGDRVEHVLGERRRDQLP